jgi:amino acid transporter
MIIRNSKLPTPLTVIAIVLICSCVIGVFLLNDLMRDKRYDAEFVVFIVIMLIIHTVVAIAVLSRRRWGLFLFKGYLYVLLLALPIGTYIALRILRYIKHDEIDNLYT